MKRKKYIIYFIWVKHRAAVCGEIGSTFLGLRMKYSFVRHWIKYSWKRGTESLKDPASAGSYRTGNVHNSNRVIRWPTQHSRLYGICAPLSFSTDSALRLYVYWPSFGLEQCFLFLNVTQRLVQSLDLSQIWMQYPLSNSMYHYLKYPPCICQFRMSHWPLH